MMEYKQDEIIADTLEQMEKISENDVCAVYITDDVKDIETRLNASNVLCSVYENRTYANLCDYKYCVIVYK